MTVKARETTTSQREASLHFFQSMQPEGPRCLVLDDRADCHNHAGAPSPRMPGVGWRVDGRTFVTPSVFSGD